ncbi:MAG: hypothetical protein FWD48_00090 [Oscillospiraceae bacterium]|nr:hypothetical protein [Oscillospiraceae bacterium]
MKKAFLCLVFAFIIFIGSACGGEIPAAVEIDEPNVGDTVLSVPQDEHETTPPFEHSSTEVNEPPLFRIDFAYNFTEEDLQGRIPIYFDGGDERMERVIFLGNADIFDLKVYSFGGFDVIDDEVVFYQGNFLFGVDYALKTDYYIDFLPPIPPNLDFAIVTFKVLSTGKQTYILGYSVYDDSLAYREAKIVEEIDDRWNSQEILLANGHTLVPGGGGLKFLRDDGSSGVVANDYAVSPNRERVAYIYARGEVEIYPDWVQDETRYGRQRWLDFEGINIYRQHENKRVFWLDDEIVLVIIGMRDGSQGGALYYYDLSDESNGMIVEYPEFMKIRINDDNLVLTVGHFYSNTIDTNLVFNNYLYYFERIPLEMIYDLIEKGEVLNLYTPFSD